MTTKTCSKCGETKDVSEFSRDKKAKDGLQSHCKACVRAYYQANKEKIAEQKRAWRQSNKEKVAEQGRAYYKANKDKILEQVRAYKQANRGKLAERQRAYSKANKDKIAEKGRAYREANKEKIADKDRAYYQANKEKIAERKRAYNQANKEKIAEWQRAYNKKRRAEDPVFAMVCRLRARLLHALNGKAKPASTMELLGCSREDLMAHLESQFTEGMTWENRSEWHVDHIRPVASFEDPADPECWHYTNLQPLWAEDNLRKGDSWDDN